MYKVIAIVSQKGGTAKSTTCKNLATSLKNMGHKVLVVDCDSTKGGGYNATRICIF